MKHNSRLEKLERKLIPAQKVVVVGPDCQWKTPEEARASLPGQDVIIIHIEYKELKPDE